MAAAEKPASVAEAPRTAAPDERRFDPAEAERSEHPGSFDPRLETGYLRRGARDHDLPVEVGAAPFDPGPEHYDSRRARRAKRRQEKAERKRRERAEKLERKRRKRERAERERREREERSRREGQRVELERRRAEAEAREARAAAERERREQARVARAELARAERERQTRERSERERRERERAERERAEREQRVQEQAERERRQRAEHEERERSRREALLAERRAERGREQRERAERARERAEELKRRGQAAPERQREASPRGRGAHQAVPLRAVPAKPGPAGPVRLRPVPGPAVEPHPRVRPVPATSIRRATLKAGLALAAVVACAAGLGMVLGLPVPLLTSSEEPEAPTAAGDAALVSLLDSGTPVGLTKGPYFPVALDAPADFGETAAKFGADRGGRRHEGQDVFAKPGTPLVAVRDGIVLDGAGGRDFYASGGGNSLTIYSPVDDRSYIYLHMLKPPLVTAGETVRAGQPVGQVGCTGSCYGPHLHFEVRNGRADWGAETKPVDPLPLLRQWPQRPTG